MKLQNNRDQYKLTIPKDIIKLMGWEEGIELVLIQNDRGEIVIKEIKKRKDEKKK